MKFYGYDSVPQEVRDIYERLLKCWCPGTCAASMREDWSPDNPSLGQCSISSFLVQDELGGEVYGIPLPGGGVHCFNKVNGVVFDLTSAQFGGKELDYSNCAPQSRETHFADPDKLRRYTLLKELYRDVVR